MWRIPLFAIATCLTLQAGPVVFTTCTLGTTTATPCPPEGLSDPPFNNVHIGVFVVAAEPTLDNITLDTGPNYFNSGCPPDVCPQLAASESARLTVNDIDYTTGPVRPGFVRITAGLDDERRAAVDWSISNGLHTYVDCLPGFGSSGVGCGGTATVPFELGVPFTVNAIVANGVSLPPSGLGRGPIGDVHVMFTVLEADGTTPVAVLPTPEPSRTHFSCSEWGYCRFSFSDTVKTDRHAR